MELKDVILSTLAEMETETIDLKVPSSTPIKKSTNQKNTLEDLVIASENVQTMDDEAKFLEGVRERLLVLFEGFQSPNNTQIEAKVDLTLNFLEYLLATIDDRMKNIK